MNNLGHMPAGLGPTTPAAATRQAPFQTTSSAQMMNNDSINGDDSDSESKPEKRSGRRKIKIEFIEDKSRRHITFSKRKAGIMKKAYELSTLTGTQVLLLVVSETGLVYTFTTPKLQPLVTKPEGKNLIQACLNAPDPAAAPGEASSSPRSAHSNHTTQSNTTAANTAVGKSVHGSTFPQDTAPTSSDIYSQVDRKVSQQPQSRQQHPAPAYGSVPMTSYSQHGYGHEPTATPSYSMNQQHPSQPAYGATYQQPPVNSQQSYYGSSTNPPNYLPQANSGYWPPQAQPPKK
ncbi:SRF-type transcription factor (DNA-binding and dimerization domain)-domain-containing protein [Fennellomyces sp. T-0311]|nr:SRF-type transcription factor (DNA-binding and dimerization domain)-domain-containing protein [Fennellomyces sp. T-0311]